MQHNNYTYLDYAENDYKFIKLAMESGESFNAICYLAQDICKKYLRHVIELNNFPEHILNGVKDNSVKVMHKFLKNSVPEFKANFIATTMLHEFSSKNVQQPGLNSYMASKEDINMCMFAIEETRKATLDYVIYLESVGGVPVRPESESARSIRELVEFSEKNRGEIY